MSKKSNEIIRAAQKIIRIGGKLSAAVIFADADLLFKGQIKGRRDLVCNSIEAHM